MLNIFVQNILFCGEFIKFIMCKTLCVFLEHPVFKYRVIGGGDLWCPSACS